MAVIRKVALSLLISVLLTTGLTLLTYAEFFSVPQVSRIVLLVSFFLTIFLILFLLFNIKQDSVTIVQERLRQLQLSLCENFFEIGNSMEWSAELEKHREKIRNNLKQGISFRDKENFDHVDELFDNFWDEFLLMMSGRRLSNMDEEKLKAIFRNVLQGYIGKEPEKKDGVIEILDELEVVQETEPVEDLEELEEIEAADEVEEPEAVEELEAVEPEDMPVEEPEEIGEEKSSSPKVDLAAIASLIEFGDAWKTKEDEEDYGLQDDLEIASPFASMFSKSNNEEVRKEEKVFSDSENLEEFFSGKGLSLIHKPFLTSTESNLQTLEALLEEEDIPVLEEITDDAIEERDGVHYINKSAIGVKFLDLNKDFKKLVDSVIG